MSSIERRLSTVARGCEERTRPALDQQDRDPVARQLDRGGQAGRAGADDQHGDVVDVGFAESMGAIVRRAGARAA